MQVSGASIDDHRQEKVFLRVVRAFREVLCRVVGRLQEQGEEKKRGDLLCVVRSYGIKRRGDAPCVV